MAIKDSQSYLGVVNTIGTRSNSTALGSNEFMKGLNSDYVGINITQLSKL